MKKTSWPTGNSGRSALDAPRIPTHAAGIRRAARANRLTGEVPMRVLLVDDEAAFAETLAERLQLRGITAKVALDGETALAMLENGDWDLVFLDVCLPGMDGVALLKILHERRPELDVVMLSGAADMAKAVQAMRRGAVNWLSKPVSVEKVLAECRKAGERAEARSRAARLAEAARWRSLGRVAEGVAHEVNNPLNIMVQAAGLIKDWLDDLEGADICAADVAEARAAVATIRAQSLRVREITRKLLMVGHGLDPSLQPLDVRAVLTRVLELVRGRLEAAEVGCDLDLPPEVENGPRPLGSALELQQICLHLVENALDAMPDGGSLRIKARLLPRAEQAENGVEPTERQPAWYELCFADNGPGIAPEVLPHIFEPFFSTRGGRSGKDAGQYAGLGLAVARSLAQGRGCELTAANHAGGGAVFCLRLPLEDTSGGSESGKAAKPA